MNPNRTPDSWIERDIDDPFPPEEEPEDNELDNDLWRELEENYEN